MRRMTAGHLSNPDPGRTAFHREADLSTSNLDPLDLVERDGVAGAVIELGRPRAFMRCHSLRVLERAAAFKIRCDSGRAEHMAAETLREPSVGRAPAHHAVGIDPVHRARRQSIASADRGAKEGSFAKVTDAGRSDVLIEIGFEAVVRRHLVTFAAFLVQAHPPALADGVIVLDAHADDGADAGERVSHNGDQRAIAKTRDVRHLNLRAVRLLDLPAYANALEQRACIVDDQHRRLAAFDNVLRPAHRVCRVDGEDLADDEVVKQHPYCGQVLLDGRLGIRGQHRLDIGRDVDWLDFIELGNAVDVEPGEERAAGPVIGHSGILVSDGRGEELEEAPRGVFAGADDRRRHYDVASSRNLRSVWPNGNEFVHGPMCNITSFMLHVCCAT